MRTATGIMEKRDVHGLITVNTGLFLFFIFGFSLRNHLS